MVTQPTVHESEFCGLDEGLGNLSWAGPALGVLDQRPAEAPST